MSTTPAADKPPVPAEDLIRQFAAHQDEAADARESYVARKTVLLEEMGDNGKPAGQDQVTTEYTASDDGTMRPKTTHKQDSTLQVVSLEPDALQMLSSIPQFPFTTPEIAKYTIIYQTIQPVDELTTYVFQVSPKQLDRGHAYFSGLIYVDNHDLAIVKLYGKWVSEAGDMKPPSLPFTMFETYCQPVSNKYWMPAYSRSDDFAKAGNDAVPVRLVIRWDDYKSVPKPASAVPATTAAPAVSPASTPAK